MSLRNLFKSDGWINLLAGFGGKSDKTQESYFGDYSILDDSELTNIWLGDGLAKKISKAVPGDALRNGFSIIQDDNEKLFNELKRLNGVKHLHNALSWARHYRGAVIVMGIQDGQELHMPVATGRVKGINWLKVYPAPRVPVTVNDIVTDPNSPYFEDVEIFKVRKLNGITLPVHATRCVIFKGEEVPNTQSNTLNFDTEYWGTSVHQAPYERLRNLGSVEQGVSNLMQEIVVGKYKLSNLANILADGNYNAIYKRIEIINASKSIINGVLLGEDEEYTRDSADVTGVPEILDRMMMMVSAVYEIPVTRLFGRSPAGENATGESDMRNYYDTVSVFQQTVLNSALKKLLNMINLYLKIFSGDVEIEYNSVWEPTQEEEVNMREKQSITDERYINLGVLSPEEVREKRFIGGYNFNTDVEGSLDNFPPITGEE